MSKKYQTYMLKKLMENFPEILAIEFVDDVGRLQSIEVYFNSNLTTVEVLKPKILNMYVLLLKCLALQHSFYIRGRLIQSVSVFMVPCNGGTWYKFKKGINKKIIRMVEILTLNW
jgi:hypothetical protein